MSDKKAFDYKKIISWALVVLVSIAFVAFFTVSDLQGGASSMVVGTVDGIEITTDKEGDWAKNYYNTKQYYQKQGAEINESQDRQIREMAFKQVALEKLIQKFSEKQKIIVSPKEVNEMVKYQYFMSKEGEFQAQQWQQFKQMAKESDKLTVAAEARARYTQTILLHYTLADLIPVSRYEISDLMNASEFKKKAKIAVAELEPLLEKAVTEQELRSFHAAGAGKYDADFAKAKTLVLSDFINERIGELRSRVSADVSKRIKAAVAAGSVTPANFAAAAQAMGMKVYTTGTFSFFDQAPDDEKGGSIPGLSGSAASNYFLLRPGQVSAVMDFPEGVAIAMVISEQLPGLAAADTTAEMQNKLMKQLTEEKRNRLFKLFTDKLYEDAVVKPNKDVI